MMALCWGICGWVQAEKVDLEKAERVAQSYVETKQRLRTRADVRLKYTATNRKEQHGRIQRTTTTPNLQDTVYYYVFSVNDGMSVGFVIVAVDNAVAGSLISHQPADCRLTIDAFGGNFNTKIFYRCVGKPEQTNIVRTAVYPQTGNFVVIAVESTKK